MQNDAAISPSNRTTFPDFIPGSNTSPVTEEDILKESALILRDPGTGPGMYAKGGFFYFRLQ